MKTPYLDKLLRLTWSDAARKAALAEREEHKLAPAQTAESIEQHLAGAHGLGQGWVQAHARNALIPAKRSPQEMLHQHALMHEEPGQTHSHEPTVSTRERNPAQDFIHAMNASAFTTPEEQTRSYHAMGPRRTPPAGRRY